MQDIEKTLLEAARRSGLSMLELVGPAPSPIERLHGRWRWHFFLRSTSPRTLDEVMRAFQKGFKPVGGDVRVVLDRDPVALL